MSILWPWPPWHQFRAVSIAYLGLLDLPLTDFLTIPHFWMEATVKSACFHLCTRLSSGLGCAANSLANSALFSETQIRHLPLWEGLLILTPPPSTVGMPPQAPLGAWAGVALSAFSCLVPAGPEGRNCAWLISALLVPKCGSPFTRQGGHGRYLYDLSKAEGEFRPCR